MPAVINGLSDSNFQLVGSFKFNDTLPVKKYKSSKTGLNVVFADVKGPIVYGFFVLATEALDDDGLPHTLEHLIFLGSESCPYKGTLDALANLCLASGTNAWTDTDHTAYTMTTAGSDGFVVLLPTYLEHIFFPTLTESGFITEVHHITGKGLDAGVVYCEMQGLETSGEQLVQIELFRSLYPGECGYRSETGGIVKNLRTSTTLPKIRAYHRKFYRPENCTVIISGHVDESKVFNTLIPVEQRLIQEIEKRESFVKPWQSPVPILTSTIVKEIKYPCDKEDNGLIYRAWQGPPINDQRKLMACTALLTYLTETSASPLVKNLVEIPDQFCSDVLYMTIYNAISVLSLEFEDVPLEKMRDLNDIIDSVLQNVSNSTGDDALDVKRIRTILENWRLKQMLQLEKSPHKEVARIIITDMIYSETPAQTLEKLNPDKLLVSLLDEPKEFWLNLLDEALIRTPYVLVLGYPSKAEYEKHTNEENARISERVKSLGEIGLKQKQDTLESAIEENSKPPPEEILAAVSVPSVDTIMFHCLTNYNTDSEQQHPLFDTKDCPVYMHLNDVDTYFIYLYVVLDTTELDEKYRPYLSLFLEYMLDSDIIRDGKVVPYELVSIEMEQEILSIRSSLGINSSRFGAGQYSYAIVLSLQLEPNKYLNGIRWIREILFQTKLDAARLAIFANKIIKSVSQYRRDGSSIVNDLLHFIMYKQGNNVDSNTALYLREFLKNIVDEIESGDQTKIDKILRDIECMRSIITKPENMVIHLAANVETLAQKYPNPSAYLIDVLPRNVTSKKRPLQISNDYELLYEPGNQLYDNCVTAIGSADTAFLYCAVPSITDFYHPDYATIMVFIQYMTQLEGPMWRSIRGLGLAYHFNITLSICDGILYLNLQKATDVVQAYAKSREIFEELLSQDSWSEVYFKAAKSSLIYCIVQREKNIKDLAFESLYSYFTRTKQDYNKQLINAVAKVSISDMTRIGKEYIAQLFNPNLAKVAIVCHGSKRLKVAEEFRNFGFNINVYETLEDSFLNPCNSRRG